MGRLDRTRGVGVSVGSRPGTRSWDDRRRALVLGMGWHDWGPGLDCLCLSEGVPLCLQMRASTSSTLVLAFALPWGAV